ncbi:MAG TPA: bifunctional riboflavin kinase/FAD synthetase [Flavobacteriales bacterium]
MKIYTGFAGLQKLKNPVVTIGTFDGVHLGHRSIIQQLKQLAEAVDGETVLLTFYPHPRMVLHPDDHNIQLLNTPEEKAELLREAGIEHLVVYPFSLDFSRISAYDYVRDLLVTGIGAHTVVVGYDHRFGRNREGDHSTLVELSEVFGFGVKEIPAHEIDDINVSSTKIRQALKEGRVKDAEKYLGYKYRLTGKVVQGDGNGRKFGYPTANIQVDYAFKLVPAYGVYAVNVHVNGQVHKGALSIGVRPTVHSNSAATIEVFIIDFNQDIYGQTVTLEFVDYIREEKKFGSIDEMLVHIANDVELAKSLC